MLFFIQIEIRQGEWVSGIGLIGGWMDGRMDRVIGGGVGVYGYTKLIL